MKLISRTILPFLLACASLTAETIPSFQSLGPNEKLEIRFSSFGCFHQKHYRFIVTSHQAEVFQVQKTWTGTEKGLVQTDEEFLGITPLSEGDLTRLDSLIEFYRAVPSIFSTTHEEISIQSFSGNEPPQRFEFVDESGETASMESVLTFPELARRVSEERTPDSNPE